MYRLIHVCTKLRALFQTVQYSTIDFKFFNRLKKGKIHTLRYKIQSCIETFELANVTCEDEIYLFPLKKSSNVLENLVEHKPAQIHHHDFKLQTNYSLKH